LERNVVYTAPAGYTGVTGIDYLAYVNGFLVYIVYYNIIIKLKCFYKVKINA